MCFRTWYFFFFDDIKDGDVNFVMPNENIVSIIVFSILSRLLLLAVVPLSNILGVRIDVCDGDWE